MLEQEGKSPSNELRIAVPAATPIVPTLPGGIEEEEGQNFGHLTSYNVC